MIKYHPHDNPINTFIIPFCHTHMVEDCVDRIWRFNNTALHRLILVDNTCEEGEFEQRLRDKAHIYIKSYRNLGGNMGWNIGAMMSTTKYITIIGDDTKILHKEWWDMTYKQLSSGHRITFSKNVARLIEGEIKDEYKGEELKGFGAISAGRGYIIHAVTMEKTLLEELGYFPDRKYPQVFADSALKNMINNSGKKDAIGYLCPGAYVHHAVGGSHHSKDLKTDKLKRHTMPFTDEKEWMRHI